MGRSLTLGMVHECLLRGLKFVQVRKFQDWFSPSLLDRESKIFMSHRDALSIITDVTLVKITKVIVKVKGVIE